MLEGKYENALNQLKRFRENASRPNIVHHIEAKMIWCRFKLQPEKTPVVSDGSRSAFLTAATIFASQKERGKALAMIRKGIRATQGEFPPQPMPFFLKDFPACNRLVQGISPEANELRREYETLMRLHKVAAAMIAFQKSTGSFPKPVDDGKSWREQIVPSFELPETAAVVSEMFAVTQGSTKTPFVVVKGADTAFPGDVATTPGKRFYDGTANTMMIVAGPNEVEWNSTDDVTTEEFFRWRESATEGFYAANCVGNVYWFPADFPMEQIRNFVNRQDRNRFVRPNE